MTLFSRQSLPSSRSLPNAVLIGSCDSQISHPETSIRNKATELFSEEGAPAFEDRLEGEGCLKQDSGDFKESKNTAEEPAFPTCEEVREQQIETTFNALKHSTERQKEKDG
ncbi:MAG: hypothetical protein OXE59_13075 [Bacteroidetes bacterium]|nr:hypothetical protein [Bacteroidota bacterium]